jgi:S-DNA-T family DNA segregation ATPase FtsK/SpoIIIE
MMLLPPLATTAVTVGVGMMMGRGKYLLMSVAATGITLVVSVIRYFSDRKGTTRGQPAEWGAV